MTGFPSDLVSFLTKLPSKRHEKIHVTIFAEEEEKVGWRKKSPLTFKMEGLKFNRATIKKIAITTLWKIWHGFSWTFHVNTCHKSTAFWSKFTPCHLSIGFICFSVLEHDMDFGQVQVMEFPWHFLKKLWDFHRIWSHFWPNCRQNDKRKSVWHFLQGHST